MASELSRLDDTSHLTYALISYEDITEGHQAFNIELHKAAETCWGQSDIRISRETLAKRSGYSLETIKGAIEHLKGRTFQIKEKKSVYECNQYRMNIHHFEFMYLMRCCGYFKDFRKHKEYILKNLSEDPYFLVKKWWKINQLSTTKLPTGDHLKLPTIKSFLEDLLSKEQDPAPAKQQIKEIKDQRGFKILDGLPIHFATKERFANRFSPKALWEAKKMYDWTEKRYGIDNPAGFIYSQAVKATREELGI